MQIDSISVSQVCQHDKHYRLIRVFEERVTILSDEGFFDTCREIQYHLDRFRTVYNQGCQKRIEKAYKHAYKHLVSAYGYSHKGHLERLGIIRETYLNNGGSFENDFMSMMERESLKQKARNWRWKIHERCKQAEREGEFIIFDTLTVNSRYYNEVWKRGSTHWRNYIQRFSRLCSGHEYVAIHEKGGRTHRNHIHVLHFCKTPPKGVRDPNRGARHKYKRELSSLKSLWPYGHSAPVAVRTHNHDPWAKHLGFSWPQDGYNDPIKAQPADAIGLYMSKYLAKQTTKKQDKQWRIKATRNLGLKNLMMVLSKLKVKDLYQLNKIGPENQIKTGKVYLPGCVVRQVATKLLVQRLKSRKTYKLLTQIQRTRTPLPSLVRSLIRKMRMCNPQNSGRSNSQNIISEIFYRQTIVPSQAFYQLLPKIRDALEERVNVRTIVSGAPLT